MPESQIERVHLVIYDGIGCGEAADVMETYPKDAGANSLLHASEVAPIDAPAIQQMGLEYIPGCEGLNVKQSVLLSKVRGAYGALEPTFNGKGSPEGHMALCGYTTFEPYQYFDETGFPPELVALVEQVAAEVIGRQVRAVRYPGTDDISGTDFIKHPAIWKPHLASTDPSKPFDLPIYASADSLIQIAYHQRILEQGIAETLGKYLRRKLNENKWRIGRIILRPFLGEDGAFERIEGDRKDYGVKPDEPTLIDYLTEAGIPVNGIGKFGDMLGFGGFPEGSCNKLHNDDERVQEILRRMRDERHDGLVTTNMVGWDEKFGHRRNPEGYVGHLNKIDLVMAEVKEAMTSRDLLIITSDHGNDPTYNRHKNHTREKTPVLVYRPGMGGPIALGIRLTYADVAKTIAEILGIPDKVREGTSFLSELS